MYQWLTWVLSRREPKTLPEAQRTQGVESITWVNLSTRIVWNWFQWNFLNWLQSWQLDGTTCIGSKIWPPDGPNCTSYKFYHQIVPFALVANLSIYIGYKFCHQMALLELVQNFTTRLTGWVTCISTLPWIALLALSVSIDLLSPSARVTSVKFQKPLSVSDREPDP